MFLDSIMLTKALPCLAEPGKVDVVGQPSHALEAVLPYLAALPSVIAYNPQTFTLTLRRRQGLVMLYSDRVYISRVKDTAEGVRLLADLVDAVNATWMHRDELEPVTVPYRAPQMLDVWSLLPQSNCRNCGEVTCMAFASGLLQHKRRLDECPEIFSGSTWGGQRATLEAML